MAIKDQNAVNVGVSQRETNNMTGGMGADAATRKKFGPAVGHTGQGSLANPVSGGGINRPTKGKPSAGPTGMTS